MKTRLAYTVAAFGFAAAGYGQRATPALTSNYPYSPALVSTISTPGHPVLVVFPLHGAAFKIPVRSIFGSIEFSPDGKALYGLCEPSPNPASANGTSRIVWCKIDLKTGDTTVVPGVAQDSASHNGGRIPSTGVTHLFGLTPPDGEPRRIPLPADGHPWMYISLSPDNQRAVATPQ